jgi:hypothetical protein
MNIYDDKTLYKLIVKIGLFVVAGSAFFAALGGGLKAGLFVLWLAIAVCIFWGVAFLAAGTIGNVSSKSLIINLIKFENDIMACKLLILLVSLILALSSVAVWNFLDHKFPDKERNIPVSEFPAPQEHQ